jgi:RHS repeat-associated protein
MARAPRRYDAAGNATSFKGITKTYNANNQQTGTGFGHDTNGNPTTYKGVSLTFDPENRLTSYGSVLTAKYTGDGLRAWKQPGATGKRYFLYDGSLPVIELNKDGEAIAVNTFGAHGLVSRTESLTSTFYTFDLQGSVAQRLDYAGNVLSSHLFAAHGNEVTTPSSDPFGSGAQWGYYSDRETGLQLLTNRYYDPSAGRFLTRDPIGYNGGVNLYSYVKDNPVMYTDPLGHDLFGITGGGSGGAAIGGLGIIGTANYSIGINSDCSCGDFTTGGAGSLGLDLGPGLDYPSQGRDSRDYSSGGFGATLGAGGGVFWSNARHFDELKGQFETTIISTPWLVGLEIDKSDSIYMVSLTFAKGWGAGVLHLKTNTPSKSVWETKCRPSKPRDKDYWDSHSWGGGGRGW